jgi:predicted NBD/HSP70 family sugar kinase
MGNMPRELSLKILKHIHQSGQVTRAELAEKFNVSQSLISKLTSKLLDFKIINEISVPDSRSGRPAGRLMINPKAGYLIGLEMGVQQSIAVVTDLAGEIISAIEEPILHTKESAVNLGEMVHLIQGIMQANQIAPAEVLGLGVGIHDIVDPISGVTYGWHKSSDWSTTWQNYPLREALAAQLPFPHIQVDDIVRALGVAEARYGRGIHQPNFVYVLVDFGIGMAIMLDGVPYIGASHIAGEITHISVGDQSTLCLCGNNGCLGTIAGAGAVVSQAEQRLAESPIYSGLRLLETLNFEDLLAASENGDKLATQVLMEAGEHMGTALAIVLNLFGPGMVILGGRMARSTAFFESAQRIMRLRALEMASRGVDMVVSPLDQLAGARGAATMTLNALFDPGEKDLVHLLETHPD